MAATASAPTGTASTRPIRCSARRRPSAGTRTACSAWFYHGGGEALYNELVNDILKLNLVGFLYFPMPTQPLGWFKKEIKSGDDFKGMKYRTVGLSADVFKEMGAAVTILPGGEIVPAMDRGLLDAAEFNNPSSDILLGFPDVSKFFMVGSHHQQAECFEIIFNKAKFDALPPELKAILRNAAHRRLGRPVLHGPRPLFEGPRGDQEARRQRHQDRRSGAQRAARGLGQGDRRSRSEGAVLQEGDRLAEGLGEAHSAPICNVNNLSTAELAEGLQALLRLIASHGRRARRCAAAILLQSLGSGGPSRCMLDAHLDPV